MAGRRPILALLTAVGMGCSVAVVAAQPPGPPERPSRPESGKHFFPRLGPDGDAMRERTMREIQKLSPEQRTDLWKVVWAVLNLPPDKRQMLLGMDEERRNKAREEIDRAMQENGIHLDEERKKAFIARYFEERRMLEERLRREADEKRRQLLPEMRERLKKEFVEAAGLPVRAGSDAK